MNDSPAKNRSLLLCSGSDFLRLFGAISLRIYYFLEVAWVVLGVGDRPGSSRGTESASSPL
jgi:hypothetical protein